MQRVEYKDPSKAIYISLEKEPYFLSAEVLDEEKTTYFHSQDEEVEFRIHFYGHNKEPYFNLALPR